MVHGPEAGLRLLDPLDDQLGPHHRLDAVRGHLHEMRGDTAAAAGHYRAAADRTTSLPSAATSSAEPSAWAREGDRSYGLGSAGLGSVSLRRGLARQ